MQKKNPLSELVFHAPTPYSRNHNADPLVKRNKCIVGFTDQQTLAAAFRDNLKPLPTRANGKTIRPSFRNVRGTYEVTLGYGFRNLDEKRRVARADDLDGVVAIFDKAIKAAEAGFLDDAIGRVSIRKNMEAE